MFQGTDNEDLIFKYAADSSKKAVFQVMDDNTCRVNQQDIQSLVAEDLINTLVRGDKMVFGQRQEIAPAIPLPDTDLLMTIQ